MVATPMGIVGGEEEPADPVPRDVFRLLAREQLPVVLWTLDGDLRVTASLGAGPAAIGLPPNQFAGLTLMEVFQTDDPEHLWIAGHCRALAGEVLQYEELRGGRVFRIQLEPLRRSDGAIDGVLGFALGISEQERAEEERRRSEARFRSLIANASEIVTILDPEGTVLYTSPPTEPILGYSPEELVDRNAFDLIHPDDRGAAWASFAAALADPAAVPRVEFRCRHADGSWRWLESIGTNLSSDRNVGGFVVSSRDVTERKQAEVGLRSNEETARRMAAAATRLAQESALLDRVRAALARDVELPDLFRTVVEAVADTFGYRMVSLYLSDDGYLHLQHQVGYPEVLDRIPLDRGVMGRVARTGMPVLLEDGRADPDFLTAFPGVISEVCVPLRDEGRVVGVLNLETAGGVRLGEADLRLMQALGEHVDVAIGRARLYSEVRASEARFRALVQHAADIVVVLDSAGKRRYGSPALERLLGYRPEQLVGAEALALVHPDDAPQVRRVLGEVTEAPGASAAVVYRVRHLNGSWRWMEATFTNLFAEPSVGGIVVNARDVTERRRAEELRERHARYTALRAEIGAALAEAGPLGGVLEQCATALVQHLDAAFARVWLFDGQVLELRASAGLYTHLDGVHGRIRLGEHKIGRIAADRQPHFTNDVPNDPWIDDPEWAVREGMTAFAGLPLLVEDRLVGVLAVFARAPMPPDVSEALASVADAIAQGVERRRAEERLAHLAYHDPLTDLPNRTAFMDRLEDARVHAHRGDTHVAVLFLDLDDFKLANDSLGHAAGDALLVAAGRRLSACLPPEALLARIGGDEFAVLLTGFPADDAVGLAERLLAVLRSPFIVEDREVFVTASIGLMRHTAHPADPDELLRDADTALYAAKAAGRNTCVAFEPGMRAAVLTRLGRETALQRAVERDELVLHYQPVVEVATGAVVGVEALVRWRHSEEGLVPPADFIGVAEQTGLIVPIGRWVLREACRQAGAWGRDYPATSSLTLGVNLSARQLQEPGLVAEVTTSLRDAGLAPERLELEVTESVAMADVPMFLDTLRALQALGVRLAIDDFGTGYSSLGRLHRLPFDILKIDGSFVARLEREAGSVSVVRAVTTLGHDLGMTVTAEGIETEAQAALLRELRVERAQGYYFSRPLDGERMTELLTLGARLPKGTEAAECNVGRTTYSGAPPRRLTRGSSFG